MTRLVKKHQPRTAAEFDDYVRHVVIGFYEVPTRDRIRILRKYASQLQRGLDDYQQQRMSKQSRNDPAAGGV
jgi:hypothetical protein